jgi:hypothetical protein
VKIEVEAGFVVWVINGTNSLDNVRITAVICDDKGKAVPVLN